MDNSGRAVELWGGVECTVNRVGSISFDQLVKSGHDRRLDDLDRIAELGIRTLRYPLLWERIAPGALEIAEWSWADERMQRMTSLGLRPVVGLVHHGSGPQHLDITHPDFASGLAAYARAVASRYPQIEAYTPVNEPLTTARFSCLYGLWYPHQRDAFVFIRALLNQCRAIVLAMRAVREVNSAAILVQTEDLGHVYSTRKLRYQGSFENERRWLTWDLLSGGVTGLHPLWDYLIWLGVQKRELEWFAENPCPPDIVGINHYVTSDRYLDHHRDDYPECFHGSNERDSYADVPAVRALPGKITSLAGALREAWRRYRAPLGITECHLGCTREEQLRWLYEAWRTASEARDDGIDVRCLTAWALFGSFDWANLLTRSEGYYEVGAFDVRGSRPRPTALAGMIRSLAAGRAPHRVSRAPGWWRRSHRLIHGPWLHRVSESNGDGESGVNKGSSILITGAAGTLGTALAHSCRQRGISALAMTRSEVDIADEFQVASVLQRYKPWAVINAAGYVRVDDAERDPALCRRENAQGPFTLARACRSVNAALVTFSSDLVFDGRKRGAYCESDAPSPLNVYGRTKAEAEMRVLDAMPALVIRTSSFFGPIDSYNFITHTLRRLDTEEFVDVTDIGTISPTYVPDLVDACLDLLVDGETGIWHLSNQGSVTWLELARLVAMRAGLDPSRVRNKVAIDSQYLAQRPLFSALTSERGLIMPTLDRALTRYMAEVMPPRQSERALCSSECI